MLFEVIFLVSVFLFYFILKDKKPEGMPPGPTEIPFLGNKPPDSIKQLETYRKTYGNMFTTRIGNCRQVTISDYKLAKEAMASIECADRHPIFKIFELDPEGEGGVLNSNGIPWVHDRRFVLRNLRDLGMGKTHLEVAIHEEAQALVDHLKSLGSKPTLYPIGLRTAVLNVIWQLVANQRYDLESEEVLGIMKLFENFKDESSPLIFLEIFFPILKILPHFIRRHVLKLRLVYNFRTEMKKVIDKSLQEHKKALDENNPKDLIDDYLIELEKEKENPESLFKLSVLHQIIADLFTAGSDTVTNMLRWVIFFMAKYPEVAKRCQQEIDQEVEQGKLVSIMDKPRLPFVEAFIAETFRHSSLIYLNVPRSTSKDLILGGYILPKGTSVTVNSYHVHYDPQFWDDPQAFKPERFLDSEGKYQAKQGRTFAFGSGRRQCPGESLARMEFFLFASAILQNFTIEKPAGSKLDETIIDSFSERVSTNQDFVYIYRKQ